MSPVGPEFEKQYTDSEQKPKLEFMFIMLLLK